jgi:pyrroloquinoline quinone (PQQ) biosynthesis protein C
MDYQNRIFTAWTGLLTKLLSSPMASQLNSPDLSEDQYRSYLLETFFHTRENPFSQVLCASNFPRDKHDLFRKFIMHALGEVKHDLLAADDYEQIGGDPSLFKKQPLPATQKLIDFTFEIARQSCPINYIAYLYHVEHLPTQNGQTYVDRLEKNGVPKSAMTFLEEHVHVDVVHNKMMAEYINELVKTESDFNKFVKAFEPAAAHHFGMIQSALMRPIGRSKS